MLFDELTFNIIKTLANDHVNFKFDDVNEGLKIV